MCGKQVFDGAAYFLHFRDQQVTVSRREAPAGRIVVPNRVNDGALLRLFALQQVLMRSSELIVEIVYVHI